MTIFETLLIIQYNLINQYFCECRESINHLANVITRIMVTL